MFKVKRKSTGEVLTVYGVRDNYFLVYIPNNRGERKWSWLHMSVFMPVGVAE